MLTLFRHAHAAPPRSEPDHERPLDARGREEASLMAAALKAGNWPLPDCLLCSSALRTRESAGIIMEVCALPESLLRLDTELYLATAETLFESIVQTIASTHCQHLLLVGHNPGLEELLGRLTRQPHATMPTASYACFDHPSLDPGQDMNNSGFELLHQNWPGKAA